MFGLVVVSYWNDWTLVCSLVNKKDFGALWITWIFRTIKTLIRWIVRIVARRSWCKLARSVCLAVQHAEINSVLGKMRHNQRFRSLLRCNQTTDHRCCPRSVLKLAIFGELNWSCLGHWQYGRCFASSATSYQSQLFLSSSVEVM